MLVDWTKMREIVPQISPNNQKKFEPISQQTEDYYLQHYLGRAFADDVQANPTNYTNLLEGETFEYCGDTINFRGLYYILAFLIYGEYTWQINTVDTFTGRIGKNRDDANTISQGREEKEKLRWRKQAEIEVQVMEKYLDVNYETYPLWDCVETKKPYTPKFSPVRKVKHVIPVKGRYKKT